MKTLALFLILLPPMLLSQQGYTATIIIEDIYWQNQNEWNGLFHSKLVLNGDSVNANGFVHYWYTRHEGEEFESYTAGGQGPSNHQDNEANQSYEMYVQVDVPGVGLIQSDPITLVKYGDPEQGVFLPVKENGTPLDLTQGSIVHWTDYTWYSGHDVLSDGELVKVRHNSLLGEKFHRGEHDPQGDVRFKNYDSYPIYYGPGGTHVSNDLIFHHRTYHDATVRSIIIENPSIYYGIEFKDPWFEDVIGYGGELRSSGMSAPFRSLAGTTNNLGITTPYKGVFLNENPQYEPSLPSYWIKAPFTKTIGGFTSYRQNLTANGASLQNPAAEETRVNFTSTNATVTANYKAHRESSISTATASNTQRKVVSNWIGSEYDLVYSSGGEIWWTRLNNSLGVIVPEKRISSAVSGCDYPSLSRIGNTLYVVWQRYYAPSNQYVIEFAKYNGSTWASPTIIGTMTYSSAFNPTPVISVLSAVPGVTYDGVEVVWNNTASTLNMNHGGGNPISWSGQMSIGGSGQLRPSLAPAERYFSTYWNFNMATVPLVTEDLSYVYLRQRDSFEGSGGGGPQVGIPTSLTGASGMAWWSSPQIVPSSGGSYAYSKSPSVGTTSGADRVYVIWELHTSTGPLSLRFASKHLPTNTWSTVVDVGGGPQMANPVISGLSNNAVVIAWRQAFNPPIGILVKKYQNGALSDQPGIPDSDFPQLNTSELSPTNVRVFGRITSPSAPFSIGASSSPVTPSSGRSELLAKDNESSEWLQRTGRGFSILDTKSGSYFETKLMNPSLRLSNGDVVPLSFEAINDTLPDSRHPWELMDIQEFDVLQNASELAVEIQSHGTFLTKNEDGKLRWALTEEGLPLASLTEISTGDSVSSKQRVNVNLSNVRGRRVQLKNLFKPIELDSTMVVGVIHFYRPNEPAATAPKGLEELTIDPIPNEFGITQNYPNPFNPETHINYQLNEPGHVQLEIYDILGRRISYSS